MPYVGRHLDNALFRIAVGLPMYLAVHEPINIFAAKWSTLLALAIIHLVTMPIIYVATPQSTADRRALV